VLSQRYDNAQQTRLSHCPVDLENLIEAFEDLKAGGTTILMVEQNVRFAERPGDTVAVMDNGRVVHEGSMEHLPAMTVLSIPRSLAVSANRDYQPLAIVAVIALASFALIGSPATWLTPTIAGLAMGVGLAYGFGLHHGAHTERLHSFVSLVLFSVKRESTFPEDISSKE